MFTLSKIRQFRFVLIAAFVLCGILLGFSQTFKQFKTVPPLTGSTYRCPSPISPNKDSFDVYLTEQSFAEAAIDVLCNNAVIKKQFGNVKITVGQNDYDTFRYINHGVSNLALVKNNVVEAFRANKIYGYDEVASHPNYNAYFIALREKPELSKEYLLGRRIGLLEYPSSRSGHIVPKTVLKTLGLKDNNVDIKYYHSHKEMRRALLSGEVDIISSYWSKADEDILSENYTTALESEVSGMRWYLKMQTRNTDLRCEIQKLISQISANQPNLYYQTIELVNGCAHE